MNKYDIMRTDRPDVRRARYTRVLISLKYSKKVCPFFRISRKYFNLYYPVFCAPKESRNIYIYRRSLINKNSEQLVKISTHLHATSLSSVLMDKVKKTHT